MLAAASWPGCHISSHATSALYKVAGGRGHVPNRLPLLRRQVLPHLFGGGGWVGWGGVGGSRWVSAGHAQDRGLPCRKQWKNN